MTRRLLPRLRWLLLLPLALPVVNGCALLSKSEPLTPRYFSAEPSGAPVASAPGGAPGDPSGARGVAMAELRLGRVTSAGYLGERLVYRSSSYELGFYDDLRWTEKPESYLRRSLARALFEEGTARRIVSGGGPTLDVELVEFAELKGAAHLARVRATFVLFDPRAVRAEGTVTVDVPIRTVKADEQPAEVVRALSEALSGAVGRIVTRVRDNPGDAAKLPSNAAALAGAGGRAPSAATSSSL